MLISIENKAQVIQEDIPETQQGVAEVGEGPVDSLAVIGQRSAILTKFYALRYVYTSVIFNLLVLTLYLSLQCGEMGHYANMCRNRNVPGNRGGLERRKFGGGDD
jgi:hypothetical protein